MLPNHQFEPLGLGRRPAFPEEYVHLIPEQNGNWLVAGKYGSEVGSRRDNHSSFKAEVPPGQGRFH